MKNKISTLLPIIAGALWGSVGVFVRGFTNGNIDNVSILVMRVLFAAIMMFVFIAIKDKSLLKINLKDVWVFACGGIVAMFGMNFCYNNAINSLSLSLAGVLLALSPVFVMFLAAILFKETITARSIVCMIFALIGCTMASGVIGGGEIAFSTSGILFGIAAAFFYGLTSIFSKIAMEKGYHALTMTFYSMLILAIVLLPFADWKLVGEYVTVSPANNIIFILMHSLCTAVLPYLLYNLALSNVDASLASILVAGAEPSAAMIFGIIFFAEMPSVVSILGLVVTIVALTILVIKPNN
jgi:drug/metabolite transporter (DMT)-like permease